MIFKGVADKASHGTINGFSSGWTRDAQLRVPVVVVVVQSNATPGYCYVREKYE